LSNRTAPRHRRHSLPMPFRQPAMSKRDLIELATRNAQEIADLRDEVRTLSAGLAAAHDAAGAEPGGEPRRLRAVD
jgi:hypothetical protein